MLNRAEPIAPAARVGWLAVLLELAPFVAVPVLFLALELSSAVLLGAAIAVSLASGIGWWRIGRLKAGVMILLARGIIFVYALGYGVTEQVNELAGEQVTGRDSQTVIDAALWFFLLSTTASAVAVGYFSRWLPVRSSNPSEEPA